MRAGLKLLLEIILRSITYSECPSHSNLKEETFTVEGQVKKHLVEGSAFKDGRDGAIMATAWILKDVSRNT